MNDVVPRERKNAPLDLSTALNEQRLKEGFVAAENKNAYLQDALKAVAPYTIELKSFEKTIKKKQENGEEITPQEELYAQQLEKIVDDYSFFLLSHTYATELNAETTPEILNHVAEHDLVNKHRLVNGGLKSHLEAGKYRLLTLVLGDEAPCKENMLAALFDHPSVRSVGENNKTPDAGLWKSLDAIFNDGPYEQNANNATFFGVTSFYEGKMKHVGDVMIAKGMEYLEKGTALAGATTLSPLREFRLKLSQRLKKATEKEPFFPEFARSEICRIAAKLGLPETTNANVAFPQIFDHIETKGLWDLDEQDCTALADIIRHAGVKLTVLERLPDGRSAFIVGNMHMTGEKKGGAYVADIIPPFTKDSINTLDIDRWKESWGLMANYRYDDTCGHAHRIARSQRYVTLGNLAISLDLIKLYNDWEMQLANETGREILPAGYGNALPPVGQQFDHSHWAMVSLQRNNVVEGAYLS